MATVYVEDKPYAMDAEQNLLHGCLSLGFNLPYFCWHPALGSVGACRQCAVKQFKDENDKDGKIVMACVTPASEGTRISIHDAEAAEFRKGVIEGLMQNHPHDCPVCDEGGECHLQDMTVMTGHDYRRYRFDKRTFRNQDLGPLVNQEMNRCIQCYRCIRYYREYAGGKDLNAFGIRDLVFFGRDRDGVLENEFSGNLVEICPTGVFTDKTLKRHYTRKWDQMFAPSICVHCGVGCNTDVGERYGTLRRVMTRYNHEVNGYFLCDRGRFGYEFVNDPERIREPMLNGRRVDASFAAGCVQDAAARGRAIGIGSPRASLETNFALRNLVGAERFYSGLGEDQQRLLLLMAEMMRSVPAPTLREIEESDAVLILGEDLTNFAPRVALSVRQSVRQREFEMARRLKIPLWQDRGVRDAAQDARSPLFIVSPQATKLDEIATATFRAAPDDIARLGFAIAHALDAGAPAGGEFALAEPIARALGEAKRPVILSGAGLNSEAVIRAAANVAMAANAPMYLAAPECNSIGTALLGGKPLSEADGDFDFAIVVENDLYRRARPAQVERLLGSARVITLDFLPTQMTARAEMVLPASSFAESEGTFVSSEGRAQRFFRVLPPSGDAVRESWRWLGSWKNLDELIGAMAAELPELEPARHAAPSARFRIAGAKIPRAPHRYSGRTAITAAVNVSEQKPPADPDSPLPFSMEGAEKQPPAALIPFFWSPGWNSIQSTNFYQREVGGPLRGGDAGVRLFTPARGSKDFFRHIPAGFLPRPGEWLFVPSHHIFGSEELSGRATAIAQLAATPHIAVGEAFADGSEVTVDVAGERFRTRVSVHSDLPPGVATVTYGIPPFSGLSLPAWGRISA
jgi:NADH-quinone oxidoreductase subunit G